MHRAGLLASVVLGGFGSIGAALAADMPVKAPVAAPHFVHNWSGVYIGGHAGYGIGASDFLDSLFAFETKGFLAGGQIGINQQSGNVVLGIEADASWARIKGDQLAALGGPAIGFTQNGIASTQIDGLVSVAGRFGFAQDHWLVYLKLGVAWARFTHDLNVTLASPAGTVVQSFSEDSTRAGHLVGFGAEYALGGNWSAKAEYNYVNFGEYTAFLTGTVTSLGVTVPVGVDFRFEQSLHLVKIGLNYRFGTPSILAAEPPARPSPGFNWTGTYVGAVAGYGFGWKDWTNSEFDGRYNVDGGLAGGVAGANVHVGRFVFGVEGEWMWTGIKGSRSESLTDGTFTESFTISTRINWLATAGVRLGVVAADRWLNYVKVGFALADESHEARFAQSVVLVGSTDAILRGTKLHTGLLLGAGTEYAFFGNWSAKAEYNYIQFNEQYVTLAGIQNVNVPPTVGTNGIVTSATIRQELHLIKFGLNYHFNPIDVVRARY